MTIKNETTYIPPQKEQDMLNKIRGQITIGQSEVDSLTLTKMSIVDDIRNIQAEKKAQEVDLERFNESIKEASATLKSTREDLRKLEAEKVELTKSVEKLKSEKNETESYIKDENKKLEIEKVAVAKERAEAQASRSEAKQLLSDFQGKRDRAVEVLQSLTK